MIDYDEQEEEKHMQSRSRRFWVKVDKRYFKQIGVDDLREIRERIDKQVGIRQGALVLQQGGCHQSRISNQLSYFHSSIYPGNSKLFQRKAIRVLFQNSVQSEQYYGDSLCISYIFGFKYQSQNEFQSIKQQKRKYLNDDQYEEYQMIDVDGQQQNIMMDGNSDDNNDDNKKKNSSKRWQDNNGRKRGNVIDDDEEKQSVLSTTTYQLTVTYWKQPNYYLPINNNITNQQADYLSTVLQLTPTKSTSDLNLLTQCNYYDLSKSNLYSTEIDRQISLWQYQYDKISTLNLHTWDVIEANLSNQNHINMTEMYYNINEFNNTTTNFQQQQILLEQQVVRIHKFLAWQHNLVNFKNGFADKNEQMLAQALQCMWIKQHKTKNIGDKRKFFKTNIQNLMQTKSQLSNIFETDCKICFSTYVSQKNKVIYCDHCNQSFHQKCYGIVNLNEDPNSKFYCDACQYRKEINYKNDNQIVCNICYIPFSPLKRFKNVFFHPLCLFLNNLLKPNMGELKLKDQTTIQNIIQKVKQYEIKNQGNECEFCKETSYKGLRFKCSQPTCSRYFHMICAYLHSNMFNIWRSDQQLLIQIRCYHHFPSRDNLRQTYLRRFFCNYNNIADLSQTEFIEIYNQQLDSIREYKLELKSNSTFRNERSNHRSSQYSAAKEQKKEQKKEKKKHKSKQKLRSKVQIEVGNLINLNSDDQQNTDYHNNSPESLLLIPLPKTSTSQCKQNQNQLQMYHKQSLQNSQYLRYSMTRIEQDLMKKKRKTIQVRASLSSSQQIVSNLLSQIGDTFGSEFQTYDQQSLRKQYDIIDVEGSFEQNAIYQ